MMSRIVLVSMLLLFTAASHGQSVSSENPKLSMIRSVVRDQGWEIPGLAQSQITSPRELLANGYGVTGVPINVTVFAPKQEFVTTISLFALKADGKTLVMGERRGAVQSIIKCDINHHVFVYIVQFMALVQEPNGRTGYSGIYGAQYFDSDGDGIFESYEPGAPFVTHELRIPTWVWPSK